MNKVNNEVNKVNRVNEGMGSTVWGRNYGTWKRLESKRCHRWPDQLSLSLSLSLSLALSLNL